MLLFIAWNKTKRILFLLTISAVLISVLIIKNIVITGYPFYPASINKINVDWAIPEKTIRFFSPTASSYGYFKESVSNNPTLFVKLKSWITLYKVPLSIGVLFACLIKRTNSNVDIAGFCSSLPAIE